MNNQGLLSIAVCVLAIVVGLLVYDRQREHQTIGEKIGSSIDRAADHLDHEIDDRDRH